MSDNEEKEMVGNFFDEGEVAIAQKALGIVGIASTVEFQSSETGDEYSVYVSKKDAERGAAVIEQVAEALTKKGVAPSQCPACQSESLAQYQESGALGEYRVYVCNDCGHATVLRI